MRLSATIAFSRRPGSVEVPDECVPEDRPHSAPENVWAIRGRGASRPARASGWSEWMAAAAFFLAVKLVEPGYGPTTRFTPTSRLTQAPFARPLPDRHHHLP